MRSLAFVILSLVLPGCSEILGMCDPYFPSATWREEGTWEALATIGSYHAPIPGLPFVHAAAWGGNLTSVEWTTEIRGRPVDGVRHVQLARDGTVTLGADNHTTGAQAMASLENFLENATGAAPSDIANWSAEGAAHPDQKSWTWYAEHLAVVHYEVRVPGPFRLEALYNETHPTPEPDREEPTSATYRGGPWEFSFDLPYRIAMLPGDVKLYATTDGWARISLPSEPSSPEGGLPEVRAALAAANLPLEGPRAADFNVVQC